MQIIDPSYDQQHRLDNAQETGQRSSSVAGEEDIFFLFRAGPLYRVLKRLHLGESPGKVLARRVAVIVAVVWSPILYLASRNDAADFTSFLSAVGLHARLLIALPLLLFGEAYANTLTSRVLQQCLLSGIIDTYNRSHFEHLLTSTKRVAGSTIGELGVLLVVLLFVGSTWSEHLDAQAEQWFGRTGETGIGYSAAGLWARYVALPVFQFILLRWIYRLLLWLALIFRISRMDLQIVPLHPDRRGGLAFMADSVRATLPVLLALSALMAGTIGERILRTGAQLPMFYGELLMIGGCALALTLGPLVFFMMPMSRARWKELERYGPFAGGYVRAFRRKWLTAPTSSPPELLGSSDIQSLADLGNSYQVLDNMSIVPFGMREVVTVLACTYILVFPLLLTMFPASEILERLLRLLF